MGELTVAPLEPGSRGVLPFEICLQTRRGVWLTRVARCLSTPFASDNVEV
jgi:hypothetical protein